MIYPGEYEPILEIDPNYDWGSVADLGQEDRIVSKAAMCILMGGALEIYEAERTLPSVLPGQTEPADEIDISLSRFETNDYPIGDDWYATFDQLFLVDDDDGQSAWLGHEGVFAMCLTNEDGSQDDQYMFKVDSDFWPISGRVYRGYGGINENARIRNPLHLSALEQFLDRLQLVIVRYETETIVRYPQIDSIGMTAVGDLS